MTVWLLMLEIVIVLVLAVFIVWWTMSGRRRNVDPAPVQPHQPAVMPTENRPAADSAPPVDAANSNHKG